MYPYFRHVSLNSLTITVVHVPICDECTDTCAGISGDGDYIYRSMCDDHCLGSIKYDYVTQINKRMRLRNSARICR